MFTREPQFDDVRRRPILLEEGRQDRPKDVARLDCLQLASATPTQVLGDSEAILNHGELARFDSNGNHLITYAADLAVGVMSGAGMALPQ
jgi:hypothetical protein